VSSLVNVLALPSFAGYVQLFEKQFDLQFDLIIVPKRQIIIDNAHNIQSG
jgi:hypothetical protein